MTDSVVVEGYARLRDGKKWKTRWLVLRKPSPVADCLVLQVFKDKSDKAQGNKERASVTLEEICGLETGQWYESVAFTLSILCLNQAALLGFDSREAVQAWEVRLRYSLGEVHRFSVGVLPGTKLESGPASLHLCNNLLALARENPPTVIGHWNLPDLRRYGPVPNGFVFEGGTRCGYWAGVFLLTSPESEHISFLFDCIVRGISPTRGPFGLRPVLPDPNASQTSSEERLNHETQELEKRLSMLSHRSSTVSSVFCPSPGGDDHSISGSSDTSDTSQSDSSIGSRLAIWSEPPTNQPPEGTGTVGTKVTAQSPEKLPVSQGAGTRTLIKAPRQLQEIGRQSSSDSGIATGSHSSYSGSFSSYTSSVDINPAADFGSVFLPPHLAQDLSPCTCPVVPGHEYQVPSSVRYLYDSPRNLLQEACGASKESEDSTVECATAASTETPHNPSENIKQAASEQVPGEAKVAPSMDSRTGRNSVPSVHKTIITICSVCGGFKTSPLIPASSLVVPAVPDKRLCIKEERFRADHAYEIMESPAAERNSEVEEKSKYELMGRYGQQRFLQDAEGAVFLFPPEVPPPERPRNDVVTYVNIPISPTPKKQLNYMELELLEPGSRGTVAPLPAQRKGSTKYAQIDITATETAHKVGTQHALGRQEGLHVLDLRRRTTQH